MAKERTLDGDRVVYVRLPAALDDEISALAELNQRTKAGEFRLALYRHLEREHEARVKTTKQ